MSVTRHDSVPMVRKVANAIASYIGFGTEEEPAPSPMPVMPVPTRSVPVARVAAPPTPRAIAPQPHKWQRHEQLRSYTPPITPDVREARRLAVRGLYAVRQNALEVGLGYLIQAAECRDVDFAEIPGFWDLTRGQMMMAVEAYDRVARYRDMAALEAQIATRFRPTLISTPPTPITPFSIERRRANGE